MVKKVRNNEKKIVKCVLFDWNGTLVDDIDLAVDSLRHTVGHLTETEITAELYRAEMTFPVADFYRTLGVDVETYWDYITREFLFSYVRRIASITLFSDVRDMLDRLSTHGMTMAVLSALHQQTLDAHVAREGLTDYFSAVQGAADLEAAGKAEYGAELLRLLHIAPASAILIGDTVHDAEVAEKTGCQCILVSHGHNSHQRLEQTGYPVKESLTACCDLITGAN